MHLCIFKPYFIFGINLIWTFAELRTLQKNPISSLAELMTSSAKFNRQSYVGLTENSFTGRIIEPYFIFGKMKLRINEPLE